MRSIFYFRLWAVFYDNDQVLSCRSSGVWVWANDRVYISVVIFTCVIIYARNARLLFVIACIGYISCSVRSLCLCVLSFMFHLLLQKNEHHGATLCVNKSAVTGQKYLHIVVLFRTYVQSPVSPLTLHPIYNIYSAWPVDHLHCMKEITIC